MMRVLITGGAGFIGCNIAKRFLDKMAEVVILDNLSRLGTAENLDWLKKCSNGKLTFIKGDIRNRQLIDLVFTKSDIGKIDLVFHMAAQVAVTTSVLNPREDFEINALGTFNLLEAIRNSKQRPIIINASTNKVYGEIESVRVKEKKTRYDEYGSLPYGVSEDMTLDFYSPYGCSKGTADQYILDYSRIYGLKTINFRQSCIYGPRQFGMEDQGWVAHFVISAILGRPIAIYGDGKQVRDVLFIDDLLDAFLLAIDHLTSTCGKAYNIGGGVKNKISLLEFISLLEDMLDKKIPLRFADWRPGDQKIYVSDIRRAKKDFGWRPKTDVKKGIILLVKWVKENKELFNAV